MVHQEQVVHLHFSPHTELMMCGVDVWSASRMVSHLNILVVSARSTGSKMGSLKSSLLAGTV